MSQRLLIVATLLVLRLSAMDSADSFPHPLKAISVTHPLSDGSYDRQKAKLLSVVDNKRVLLYDIANNTYDYNREFAEEVISAGHSNNGSSLYVVRSLPKSSERTVFLHDLTADKESPLCSSDDDVRYVTEYDEKGDSLLMIGDRTIAFYDKRSDWCSKAVVLKNLYSRIRSVIVDNTKDEILVMTEHELRLYDLRQRILNILFKTRYSEHLRSVCRVENSLLLTTDMRALHGSITDDAAKLKEICHVRPHDKDDFCLTSISFDKRRNGLLLTTDNEIALNDIARKITQRLFMASGGEKIGPVSFSANEKEIYVPTSERMLTFANPLDS